MSALAPFARVRAWRAARRYQGPMVLGTRTRSLPMIGIGLAGMAAMYQLVAANAMAVNFTTADHTFKLYSNYVQGTSAAGFLDTNSGYSSASRTGVAEIGIKTAKLAGLCGIAQESLPVVGHVSLLIMSGVPVKASFTESANTTSDGAGNPISLDGNGLLTGPSLSNAISVTDLFLNTNLLNGYGNQISGLNLGQNASDVAGAAQLSGGTGTWPNGQTAPTAGNFGLTAQNLNIGGLDGTTYGINLAGQITLPKLKLEVLTGDRTQADCQSEATS